jgi:hypothetical protein
MFFNFEKKIRGGEGGGEDVGVSPKFFDLKPYFHFILHLRAHAKT